MKHLLLISLILVISNLTSALVNGTREGRVVRGDAARNGQFPHQASLICCQDDDNYMCSSCGGSLISNRFILTAGHCTEDILNFDIGLGSSNRFQPELRMYSREKIVHPRYDTRTLENDISLVKLPYDVKPSINIKPAILARREIGTLEGKDVAASGFGGTVYGGSASSKLNFMDLKVISNAECKDAFKSFIYSTTLCAKGLKKTQTLCHGDSGGPLVIQNGKMFTQVGVISFTYEKCTPGMPTGYARVSSFVDWISSETGIRV